MVLLGGDLILGDILREKELELFVGELAQLRTEDIVDSDVVCIASAKVCGVSQERKIGEGRSGRRG